MFVLPKYNHDNEMRICPNRNIEILSTLSKDEVIDKFRLNIEFTERLRIMGIRHQSFRDYEGHINNDKVLFRRILKSGMNSFIPQISGVISESDSGTKIQLNARLHKVVEGFLIGFNCFLLLLLITELINIDISTELETNFLFLPGLLVMFVLVNGLPGVVFYYELYWLEKDFRRILVSEESK